MAEKKEERTLEMRIAELENKLGAGAQQVEFTEQEAAAYNKVADALGVHAGADPYGICRTNPCRIQACRVQTCIIQPCRIQTCRIQTCRIQACRLNPCRIQQPIGQCISQCINECGTGYAGDYEADLGGGFGTLGYY